MTTNSIISIALAVLCVVSIGVTATSLESAMQTDPDEVIDLDWDAIPIGEETAAELKRQMETNGDERSAGGTRESEAPQGDPEPRAEQRGQREESQVIQKAQSRDARAKSQSQQASGASPEPPEGDAWLWLVAAFGLLGALLAVGYRYRDRLGFGRETPPADGGRRPWPPGEPSTEVERAWLDLVGRLEVDRPWARTPAEFAAAAVDAGMDAEAVDQVTATFVTVRYGGDRVTGRHRERVRAALHELGRQREGESA